MRLAGWLSAISPPPNCAELHGQVDRHGIEETALEILGDSLDVCLERRRRRVDAGVPGDIELQVRRSRAAHIKPDRLELLEIDRREELVDRRFH